VFYPVSAIVHARRPERNIVLCRPMRWHGEGVESRGFSGRRRLFPSGP
jgi:hypothetical protein